MSQDIVPARTIDGMTFARTRGRTAGSISGASLPRVVETGALLDAVEYAIDGGVSGRGVPALRVTVAGRAAMQCQRCLEQVEVPVEVDVELELAASQAEVDAADDDIDRVVTAPAMEVRSLIEDEVLLALPMVARHSECGVAAAAAPAESLLARALRERRNPMKE